MIRAFLAIELTENLRTRLGQVQQDLKQRFSRSFSKDVRVSWVQPASIHLTIKFLGDINEQLVDPMHAAVMQVMEGRLAIQIPLERLGVFPRLEQPRVLWIGPPILWEQGEAAQGLSELHQLIEECCQSFGFIIENRPFSPHLTLARIKEGERQVGRALAQSGILDRPLAMGQLATNRIALVKSELRPSGPVYTRLWEVGEATK